MTKQSTVLTGRFTGTRSVDFGGRNAWTRTKAGARALALRPLRRLYAVVADAVGGEEVVSVDDAVGQVAVRVDVAHRRQVDGDLAAHGVVLEGYLEKNR